MTLVNLTHISKKSKQKLSFLVIPLFTDDKTGQFIYNENRSMPVENFLTTKQVAKKLCVSERSVMRYIKAKKLRASKMGQWRVKEKDLKHFFNANCNK